MIVKYFFQKLVRIKQKQFCTVNCRYETGGPVLVTGPSGMPRLSYLPSKRWRCRYMALIRLTLKSTDTGRAQRHVIKGEQQDYIENVYSRRLHSIQKVD